MFTIELCWEKPGFEKKKLVGQGPRVYTLYLGILKVIYYPADARSHLINSVSLSLADKAKIRETIGKKRMQEINNKVMRDIAGIKILVDDKVARHSGSRADTFFRMETVVGFTETHVKLASGTRAKPESLAVTQRVAASQEPMLYWYSLSFVGKSHGNNKYANTYKGYPTNVVTIPRIQEAEIAAGFDNGPVLLSVCYMGYATRTQITETSESEETDNAECADTENQ